MSDFLQLENRHTGEILRMRRMRDGDGRMILALDGSLPPGTNGPPPHIHFLEREEGTVFSGTLGAKCGGETLTLTADGQAVFPAGTVHSWWNAGNDLLEFRGRAIPAVDLDRYLQGLFAVLNSSASGRPSLFYLAHVVWRHRHTQTLAAPPRAVQRILFPAILFVGRLLGKYRGDAWPGSPASCTGAPEV